MWEWNLVTGKTKRYIMEKKNVADTNIFLDEIFFFFSMVPRQDFATEYPSAECIGGNLNDLLLS